MSKYAESTSVSAEMSRIEIEKTLIRYGATGFAYVFAGDKAMIGFTMCGRQVRFVLPLPEFDSFTLTPTGKRRVANFGSTMDENLHRIYTLRDLGYDPYVMVYDKPHAATDIKRLQRWCNNKIIFKSVRRFEDYNPHYKNGGETKMSIIRLGELYIPVCDYCDEELPVECDFYDAVESKKDKGWRSIPDGHGGWSDACPECARQIPYTSAANDFAGVGQG